MLYNLTIWWEKLPASGDGCTWPLRSWQYDDRPPETGVHGPSVPGSIPQRHDEHNGFRFTDTPGVGSPNPEPSQSPFLKFYLTCPHHLLHTNLQCVFWSQDAWCIFVWHCSRSPQLSDQHPVKSWTILSRYSLNDSSFTFTIGGLSVWFDLWAWKLCPITDRLHIHFKTWNYTSCLFELRLRVI